MGITVSESGTNSNCAIEGFVCCDERYKTLQVPNARGRPPLAAGGVITDGTDAQKQTPIAASPGRSRTGQLIKQ